jgi:hypothetical protein
VRLPLHILVVVGVFVAAILLAIFPTMPSWPFTDVGLVVGWILIAHGLSAAAIFMASYWYA